MIFKVQDHQEGAIDQVLENLVKNPEIHNSHQGQVIEVYWTLCLHNLLTN